MHEITCKPPPERKPILVVDNYDSFTFNLVQLLGTLGQTCVVVCNDHPSLDPHALDAGDYAALLLSPGPGTPAQAGACRPLLEAWGGRLPVLGVCLGHQLIAEWFGAKVVRARRPLHGKVSTIDHDGQAPFQGMRQGFLAARYNSLVVDRDSLPRELEVCAWSDEGEVMGLRHRELRILGIQFHPESILSEAGRTLMHDWTEAL